jgi:CubicO group peptidase (beta-lactamase class C family)
MNRAASLLLIAALATPAVADPAEDALASRFRAVEAIVDAQLERESVPGAAFGVVHDQTLIWSHRYGVESLETGRPVTDDTLFSICSISKLFNGVAAMNLVEQGRIDLDAPLADYVDGIELQDSTGGEAPVTVHGILSHVSGFPRESRESYWAEHSFPDDDELLLELREQSRLYRSYDYWQYSNLGMAMLGQAIAKVSGKPWGDYVKDEILTPLGMARTATDMPFDQVGDGFAQGYFVRNAKGEREPAPEHRFKAFAPAAGIASSVNDLARFASWHFRLQANGGEEVLEATTQKKMLRVHWVGDDFEPPFWGLAYANRRLDNKMLWGHGGYCPGTRAEFLLRLRDKIGVMGMTTANDVSPNQMASWIFALTADSIAAVHGADEEEGEGEDDKRDEEPEEGEAEAPAYDPADYEGYYGIENYDWDGYVGIDTEGLFFMRVFADNPVENLQHWVHEEGDVFRRKRDNGDLAEPIRFERDENGRVTAVVQHSYRLTRR